MKGKSRKGGDLSLIVFVNHRRRGDSVSALDCISQMPDPGRMAPTIPETLAWQAIDPSRNIARCYAVTTSTDLFGWLVVERSWGRIGSKGQGRRQAFADEEEARLHIRAVLRRRASAVQRLGVAYVPIRPER